MVGMSITFKVKCSIKYQNNLETLLARHNIEYVMEHSITYKTEVNNKKIEYKPCIYRCTMNCETMYELNEAFEKFVEDCNSEPYFISIGNFSSTLRARLNRRLFSFFKNSHKNISL